MKNNILPAFNKNNVPVIFSTDKKFVPYLDVCLKSLIANNSKENNYDIVILYSGLTERQQERLSQNQKENVSIRFVDMDEYMAEYQDL